MEITLRDASVEDEGLLLEIYSSTRAKEMALVPWSDPQKEAFVKMQFQAQQEIPSGRLQSHNARRRTNRQNLHP